jgi:hypothetical protein
MADKKGTGLLMVWVDVPADREDEFNHWYNEEHLPELLAVPGVLSAARYEAVSSGPKHLACYELESSAVVDSDAFKDRPATEWAQRVGPRAIATTLINNVYEMVYPASLTPDIAQGGMAEALQIGRMGISPENEEEWNRWYSGVYVPNYEKVPGCIRGRRWRATRGEPQYGVVYEFEHEGVSGTDEWLKQRDINPDNERMRSLMTHAPGSPGIWKKTFQP